VVAARALVGLVAVAACAALLVLAFRDGGAPAETSRERVVRPTIKAGFQPGVHRFGEPVVAQIELTARSTELDPETVQPAAEFEPYRALGNARRELDEFGALTRLRFTVQIECLRQACLPETQTGEFDFGGAAVTWRIPAPPGRRFSDRRLDSRSARGDWPALKVASWLSPDDVREARWRSTLGELPEPSYAVSPRWLTGGLLGGAVALVLLAGGLVGGSVREVLARRRVAHEAEADAHPLARAVGLVEESRLNGDVPGRRVALETLARELWHGGQPDLAADAERLAWSPDAPPDAAVATLVVEVRARNGDLS
jgi:hypothetical protein